MESAQEGRLRWLVFGGNGFMYVFFIVAMILHFAIFSQAGAVSFPFAFSPCPVDATLILAISTEAVNINCSNVDQITEARKQITPAQILSIVYKVRTLSQRLFRFSLQPLLY